MTTAKHTTATLQLQSGNHLSVHQWLRSAIHESQHYRFPILETSAAAWCGPTGINEIEVYKGQTLPTLLRVPTSDLKT